jgi:hypothetical protein
MFASLLLPSASFDISEGGPSALGSQKSLDRSLGLRILQKIAPALLQSGYRIIHLKRRSASVASLRCGKCGLRVGMILSAVAYKGGDLHCELDIWRVYSIFVGQEVRRRKIQQDIDPLRELYCVIDRQVRTVFKIDTIRWAVGARGLQIIGSDGRPSLGVNSERAKRYATVSVSASAE